MHKISLLRWVIRWLVIAAVATEVFFYFFPSFDGQKILQKSILQNKNIGTQVQEIEAQNSKIKAYLFEDHTNQIVALNFMFKGAGNAGNKSSEQGLSTLLALSLADGGGKYGAQNLKEQMEDNGIMIAFGADKDNFTGSLLASKEAINSAADILRSLINSPHFAEPYFSQHKKEMLWVLKNQQENPATVLSLELQKELFGQHPYARNPYGKAGQIKQFTPQNLQNFKQKAFGKDNLIVSFAGDISAEEAAKLADKIFAALPSKNKLPALPAAEINFDGRQKHIEQKIAQNVGAFVLPSVERNHTDFYPLYVANYVFGGAGLSSRLSKEIREKQGLTYSIYSYMSLGNAANLLFGGFFVNANNEQKVKAMLDEQMGKFAASGPSKKEFADAVNYMISSFNLRFASTADIADILTAMQQYNLGIDFLQKRNQYVKEIKLQDVRAVAGKYFNKDHKILMTIGESK